MSIEDVMDDTGVSSAGLNGREASRSGTTIGWKPRVASIARGRQSNVDDETDASVGFQVSEETA